MRILVILSLFFTIILAVSCGKKATNESNANDTVAVDSQNNQQDSLLKREVFGIKIGETTISEALNIMKEKGYTFTKNGSETYLCESPIQFGGSNWECIYFIVFNNKIVSVNLVQKYVDEHKLNADFESIYASLKDKYSQFETDTIKVEPKLSSCFMDDKIMVDLKQNYFSDGLFLSLGYIDYILDDERQCQSYDEL